MIDEILKDHKPGNKPRFFLHDEMKAWLVDNLDIQMHHFINRSADYSLQRKLNLYEPFPVALGLELKVAVAGEPLVMQSLTINLKDYEDGFHTVANVIEQCMVQISNLQAEIHELRRRIDLLENPNPLPK